MPDVRFRAPAEKRTRACDRRRARDGAGENQFSGFRATLIYFLPFVVVACFRSRFSLP